MEDSANAIKSAPLRIITIALLAGSIIFYTLSGVMVAFSGNHEADKDIVTSTLSFAGIKQSDSQPNTFNQIQMSLRVMPSQNEEFNMQLMTFTKESSAFTSYYADGIADDVS